MSPARVNTIARHKNYRQMNVLIINDGRSPEPRRRAEKAGNQTN
jgi:hypothetical protein